MIHYVDYIQSCFFYDNYYWPPTIIHCVQCLQHLHSKLSDGLIVSVSWPTLVGPLSCNKCWFASILWEVFSVKYSWYPTLLKNPTLPLSNLKVWCSYKLKRLPSLPIFLSKTLKLFILNNCYKNNTPWLLVFSTNLTYHTLCFCTFWRFSLHGATVMLFHFFFLVLPAYS